MANGKTEAWYVLSAQAGARVGVGLKTAITSRELRDAIGDGSIADLVEWRTAATGDVFFIPAGTIHAIGPGLVIAEIQQRSDTTFRLFDPGYSRELHVEQAVVAADLNPARAVVSPTRLTATRTQLTACAFFVFERLELPGGTVWELSAESETWLLVAAGEGAIGSTDAAVGNAFFAQGDSAIIQAGPAGLTILVAYADSVAEPDLVREVSVSGLKWPSFHTSSSTLELRPRRFDPPFRPMEGRE